MPSHQILASQCKQQPRSIRVTCMRSHSSSTEPIRTERLDLCDARKLATLHHAAAPNGGSRVKGSKTLLTKRDLPRRGGRNNWIPAISTGHLIRPGAPWDG
jgi:hypothetical protein